MEYEGLCVISLLTCLISFLMAGDLLINLSICCLTILKRIIDCSRELLDKNICLLTDGLSPAISSYIAIPAFISVLPCFLLKLIVDLLFRLYTVFLLLYPWILPFFNF